MRKSNTENKLRRIIKEELSKSINEGQTPHMQVTNKILRRKLTDAFDEWESDMVQADLSNDTAYYEIVDEINDLLSRIFRAARGVS